MHLAALEAAATAQTGGGRGWRGRGEGGGAGAVGERWGGSQDEALEALGLAGLLCAELSPWLSGRRAAWDRFPVTVEGQSGVGRVGGGGGGQSLPLNLAKWQHLRAL